jgi:hypothetical protein
MVLPFLLWGASTGECVCVPACVGGCMPVCMTASLCTHVRKHVRVCVCVSTPSHHKYPGKSDRHWVA